MTLRHRTSILAVVFAVVLMSIACGKKTPPPAAPQPAPQPAPPLPPPKVERTRLTLAATADSNPDASVRGRDRCVS
jgi:predicted component of type VI protein secretion system